MTRVLATPRGRRAGHPDPAPQRRPAGAGRGDPAAAHELLESDRRRRDVWLAQRLAELSPDERAALRAAAPVLEKLAQRMSTPEMFRALAGAQLPALRLRPAGLSLTGTWMQRTAQDWLVLEITGNSGVALGIVTALQFLPVLLLGLYGGVLADRFDKRRLLIGAQAAMGLLALVLGLLVVTGSVQLWHVYVLAALLGLAAVVDTPVRQSFVSEMVGRDLLTNAVSLNSTTFNAGRVLGPAVAGVDDRRDRHRPGVPGQRGQLPGRDRRAAGDADRRPQTVPPGAAGEGAAASRGSATPGSAGRTSGCRSCWSSSSAPSG